MNNFRLTDKQKKNMSKRNTLLLAGTVVLHSYRNIPCIANANRVSAGYIATGELSDVSTAVEN